MAEDTPGLAADLLASLGALPETSESSTAPNDALAKALSQALEADTRLATPPQESLKRSRSIEAAVNDPVPEKRQKTEHDDNSAATRAAVSAPVAAPVPAPAAGFDISAMLSSALGNLDEQQLGRSSPVDGEARSLPPPAVSPITPPGPTERTLQNQVKFASNPLQVMRSMSLPMLGNTAVQLLLALSQQPRVETSKLLADRDSAYRKSFDLLMTTFAAVKKLFSEDGLIISADELEIKELEDRESIRMANLATACTAIFGEADVPMDDIHEAALRIFVAEDGEVTEDFARLLLGLKSRAFVLHIAAPGEGESQDDLLDKFFASDLKDTLRRRNLFGGPLAPVEEDLLKSVKDRRAELAETWESQEKKESAMAQFSAEALLDQLGTFLQGYLATIVDYAERYGVNIPSNDDREPSLALFGQLENSTAGQIQTSEAMFDGLPAVSGQALPNPGLLPDAAQQNAPVQDPNAMARGPLAESDSLPDKGLAALISARLSALDGQAAGDISGTTNTYADGNAYAATYQAYDQPYYPYQNPPLAQPEQAEDASGNPLPPNQTFPTSILYERAKQASVAKTSAHARREGIHSTRRPWSSEEEKALMMGLDMVKGPHWSQILGIFGHNGTISDILKDRTQVQLKDKARNLKLFFLKTNSEMPYYLQCVTGELKTRAPSQAARREAEDRARMNSDEEQARLAGIMTLAGGLQNNASAGTTAASTANVSASPGTPTPYVGGPLRSAATPAPAVSGPATPATRSGPSPIQPLSAITGPRYLAALANQARVAAQQRPASPANLAPAIKKEPAEALSLPRSAATIQPTTLGNLDIRQNLAARKTSTPPAVHTPTAVQQQQQQQPPVTASVPTSIVPVSQAAIAPSPVTTIAATAAIAAPANPAPDHSTTSLSQEAADALQEANMVQALREVVAGP